MFDPREKELLEEAFAQYHCALAAALPGEEELRSITISEKTERRMARLFYHQKHFYYTLINTTAKCVAGILVVIHALLENIFKFFQSSYRKILLFNNMSIKRRKNMNIQLKKSVKITGLCCAVALILSLGLLIADRVFVTQHITGLLPERTPQEMIEKAHLIVKGTFEDRSKAFQIRSANGQEESNFTDYTLRVEEVYRGDAVQGEAVTVRTQGGFVGTLQTVADFEPEIKVGDTVFLYLYQPNIGGSYETDGDYYYVLNGIDGLYHYHSAKTLTNPATDENMALSDTIKMIENINKTHPVNENWVYEELQKSLKKNLETGFITQEEYTQTLSQCSTYGTVTKTALFK